MGSNDTTTVVKILFVASLGFILAVIPPTLALFHSCIQAPVGPQFRF